MELAGEYTFDAPQEAVWNAIMDPEVLANILPGCESLEQISDTEYKGTLNVRVGPVQGRFDGTVTLSDMQKPDTFHLDIDGKGSSGYVKGGGDARLADAGGQTALTYEGEAQVGGRIASVGQRLLDTTAKSIVRQSLESLDRIIQAQMQPQPDAEDAAAMPAPEIAPPSQTEVAMGLARDVYYEYVPDERRPIVIAVAAAVGAMLVVFLLIGLLSGDEEETA